MVQSQLLLTKKNRYHAYTIFAILVQMLFLTGCDTSSGLPYYEIRYPSGNEITCLTDLSEPYPIENSTLQIYTEHVKGSDYVLYIQDDKGEILYQADTGFSRNRGMVANGELWICGESWSCVHQQQFVDNTLTAGILYRLDIESGEITFEEVIAQNEFFITMNEGRCYFYNRGREREEKLFGLVSASAQNAKIYFRDISDWEQTHLMYVFDYAGIPQEASGRGNYTIHFSMQEKELIVMLNTSKMLSDGTWEDVSVWSINISIMENNMEIK